jgi:hypothetical protein
MATCTIFSMRTNHKQTQILHSILKITVTNIYYKILRQKKTDCRQREHVVITKKIQMNYKTIKGINREAFKALDKCKI